MARLEKQCNMCKWWKTDHGLVWFDDVEAWLLGAYAEKGYCEFHNDYCDGGYCCSSWEPSVPVGNKNGWNQDPSSFSIPGIFRPLKLSFFRLAE